MRNEGAGETPAVSAARAPARYERLLAAVSEIARYGDEVGLWVVLEAWFFADRPRPAAAMLEVLRAIATVTPPDELEELATQAEHQLKVTIDSATDGVG
jgi:hypothetical protein